MMIVSKVWLDLTVTHRQALYITLTLDTSIQSKDVILKVSENKEQLIHFIFIILVANAMLIIQRKLIVTEKDPASLQIFNGHISHCGNSWKTQKEADTIIIHHLVASALTKVIVVVDETNMFVLLLHFTFIGDIKSQIHMQPTDKESSAHVIDIAATYQSHIKVMPNNLAAHDVSG